MRIRAADSAGTNPSRKIREKSKKNRKRGKNRKMLKKSGINQENWRNLGGNWGKTVEKTHRGGVLNRDESVGLIGKTFPGV